MRISDWSSDVCSSDLDPIETEGANDPWQLAQLERAFQRRQVRALCALGVRFADPARVDIRGEVTAEQDVEIDVDVAFEGRVRSEEHTSELQSLMRISYAVFCLKKKRQNTMLILQAYLSHTN